jgi:signal peptidase II
MTTHVDTAATHAAPTWKSKRAWILLLVVTLVGVVIDLGSKELAFRRIADAPVDVTRADVLAADRLSDLIPHHTPVTVVPGLLDFTLVLNPGAVFGIGAGKRWFFIGFTAIALAFGVMLFATWTRPKEWIAHASIGLLLAGGLGNLYDRLVFACVRDFIHPLPNVNLPFGWSFPWGGRQVWPYVSNVADLFLIIGIGVLVIRAMRAPKHH